MIGTCIDTAAAYLSAGKIVAFPTETYYGLAVDPENDQAVQRLYRVKNRQAEKPLLLLIHDFALLDRLVQYIPVEYVPFMKKYWPGALTLIFPANKSVSRLVTGGTDTIGVRISPHPLAYQLGSKFGNPITATSANISGSEPASAATEISEIFGDQIDYVLDGGIASAQLCSTILTSINGKLTVLRQGQVVLQEDNISQ